MTPKAKSLPVVKLPKGRSLTRFLAAIGVTVTDAPTREHIERAHRIFRHARGQSVEVNNLWNFIKRHVCPVCDGVKLRAQSATCSVICGMSPRRKLMTLLCVLCVSVAMLSGCADSHKNPQAGVEISTNATPVSVSESNKTSSPSPIAASIERAVAVKMTAMSIVAPPKTNAVIGLRFVNIDASAVAFRIYNTNGTLLMTLTNDNCILTGYAPGQVAAFCATAVNALGIESDQTTEIVTAAARLKIGVEPFSVTYARMFTWPCANGVTNILQESDNLFAWTSASRFRGTNGTASVTLTNQTAFHRVLVQNATNVPPMTLTQQPAFVSLAWNSPLTPSYLEREVNTSTGSFVVVQTNTTASGSTVLPFLAGAKYRVAGQ